MPVVNSRHGGVFNSSTSCEWQTGCVPLAPDEWLAATFEWQLVTGGAMATPTMRCVHDHAFLKKSEAASTTLPAAQKLYVAPNTTVRLFAPPRPAQDGYWVVACANGTVCGAAPPPHGVRGTAPARGGAAPRCLLIGDSIKEGYFPAVEAALAGRVSLASSSGNAGNANHLLHNVHCYLRQQPQAGAGAGARVGAPAWDVVTFNAGIHDLARGQEFLDLPAYIALMTNVTAVLTAAARRVVLVTTTPVPSNATDKTSPVSMHACAPVRACARAHAHLRARVPPRLSLSASIPVRARLSVSVSISVRRFVSVSLCRCVAVSLCLFVCLSVCACLSVCVHLSSAVSPSPSLRLCLSVPLPPPSSLPLPLPLPLPASLSLWTERETQTSAACSSTTGLLWPLAAGLCGCGLLPMQAAGCNRALLVIAAPRRRHFCGMRAACPPHPLTPHPATRQACAPV